MSWCSVSTDQPITLASAGRVLRKVLVACLYFLAPTLGYAELQTRVRITFDSPTPVAWRGEVWVDEGDLEKLQQLNLDSHAASSSWLQEGRLQLEHRRLTNRDAVDVSVRHNDTEAQLLLKINQHDQLAGEPIEVPLQMVRSGGIVKMALGSQGEHVTVERVATDRLRIGTPRKSMLFRPGEEFCFSVFADPPSLEPGEPFEFNASLSRGRSGDVVWQGENERTETPVELNTPPTPLEACVPMPREEGVYRITLTASRPAGFTSRFIRSGKSRVLAQREFQVAVFDPANAPKAPGGWRETYAFDPASQRWSDRVPDWIGWKRLPWFEEGPQASFDPSGVGRASIPAASVSGEAPWRAYPLPIARPGEPHVVEVELPTEGDQRVAIVVLDANALGSFRPLGEGVEVATPRWNRPEKSQTRQLVVWPRTNTPLLMVCNLSTDTPAKLGRIRVLESTTPSQEPPRQSDRLVALDWPSADLPRLVGASHAVDDAQSFEIADLQTEIETARRLADRVQLAGANGAVIDASSSGATIYPTTRQSGSPRWDLGAWVDGGADLPRRERLEVIFREFDRRGLRLVPALRFDAALPAIERSGKAYNPIDPMVTNAQAAVLAELLSIGRRHRSFAGVAVRLGSEGWALLSEDAGYDASTVDRYLATEGLRWPDGIGRSAESHAAALRRSTAERWRGWREEQLTGSFERLAQVTSRAAPRGGDFFLLPTSLHLRQGYSDALTPRLSADGTTASGLGFGALSGAGYSAAQPIAMHSKGEDAHGAAVASLAAAIDSEQSAGLVRIGSRRSIRLINSSRLLSKSERAVSEDLSFTALLAPDPGDAFTLREGFDARRVIDGAAATAGLLDEAAADARRRLAQTPAQPDTQPVEPIESRVKVINQREGGYLVATNPSAWPTTLAWTLQTPARTLATPIASDRAAEWYAPGRYSVSIQLPPYGCMAWRLSQPGAQVLGVRSETNGAAQEELSSVLADLQKRDTTVRRQFDRVPNQSFEQLTALDEPIGWNLSGGASLLSEDAHDGERVLRLDARRRSPAFAECEPFPLPETGQLVVLLQLRATEASKDARLRVELQEAGGSYYNETSLAASALLPTSDGAAEWREVIFPVDDLPLGRFGKLTLKLELEGSAVIEVDNLRAEDLILPLDGYADADLRAEKLALVRLQHSAETALAEGRIEDCRRALDSYWARFLTKNFPLAKAEKELATEEPSTDEENAEEETPSIADRLKGYLPSVWR